MALISSGLANAVVDDNKLQIIANDFNRVVTFITTCPLNGHVHKLSQNQSLYLAKFIDI